MSRERVYRSRRELLVAVVIWVSRRVPLGWLLQLVVCGVDVPGSVRLGRDVRFPHAGQGVVIHPAAVIGDRVVVYHGVTLAGDGRGGAPVVEDDVLIGAGAVVIGAVRLGRGCRVGANAVVTGDVPAGGTAVGVPARVLGLPPAA